MKTSHYYRQTGFPVARASRKIVRRYAHYLIDYVRDDVGSAVLPFPIVKLIEFWGAESGPIVERDRPNYEVCDPDEIPHADAEFLPHKNLIRIDRHVWDQATEGNAEARWILAHEVGHVVLKHYAAAGLFADHSGAVDPEVDSEHQANWFADELMMDSRHISGKDGTDALMARFDITRSMATTRIRELILEISRDRRG